MGHCGHFGTFGHDRGAGGHHGAMAEIVELLVAPAHRWDGRPDPALTTPDDTVTELVIRAGLGVVGDRYFNQPAHRDAAVTVVAAEVLAPWHAGLAQTRRNVLLRGVDVDAGVGRTLSLDSGGGPVLLRVNRAAHPCSWLDLAVAPGAWRGLRGRGGVRCSPLTDGTLRVGPVTAIWTDGE